MASDNEPDTGATAYASGGDVGADVTVRRASPRRLLPAAGVVVAAWSALPPYTGPEIGTSDRVEIADHVVPAVVMLAVSLVALVWSRRRAGGLLPLGAGLGVLLAGAWMTATHVPLVAQATRGEVGAGAAAYHTAPGLAVVALGVVWVAVHWSDAE